jgi:MerR family copper efflux transcriptional regulator
MRIGEVAQSADVGIETIRYYEREGLLPVPRRRSSGYREYDETAIARLQFIRRTKQLGFSLNEIKQLVSLWFNGSARCAHVRERAAEKVADIEDKIRSLQRMKRTLKKLIAQCESRDSLDECPLLEGLGGVNRQD